MEKTLRGLERLLGRREEYFDKRGALNSEGIKLLRVLAREAIRDDPGKRVLFREVMRKRTYESVLKLAERLAELTGGPSPS
ncbi:MAG: hypothetical protein NZ902_01450 [Acidilobaceae archaeon]|nr:hypothetical protein [Acidilobaceae archaeon]MCX8165489.1 hypothetical protein [Acidilobaceae archaeon]MDW7973916.1 hypothetical protein [Sulfolobales archaeon]